jgi:hypothetical protein
MKIINLGNDKGDEVPALILVTPEGVPAEELQILILMLDIKPDDPQDIHGLFIAGAQHGRGDFMAGENHEGKSRDEQCAQNRYEDQ